MLAKPGFWDDHEQAAPLLKERTAISERIDSFNALAAELEDSALLFEMAMEEQDGDTLAEVDSQLAELTDKIEHLSLSLMLSGADDRSNAIISINAGAGGTEAQDWAEILFRMYSRWIERKG